jgi:hypothetical protein
MASPARSRRVEMAHYLFRARHSQQGIQGVLKEGAASRLKAINDLVASVGGQARQPIGCSARTAGPPIVKRGYSVGVVVLCDGASRRSTCFSNRPCAC